VSFLNKKEQVFDIRLTSFGKKQLSKVGFRPEYYAFFDDGVIYHKESENQNATAGRIVEDLVPRTQVEFTGVDTRFDIETNKILFKQRDKFVSFNEGLDPVEQAKSLQYMLARQTLGTQKTPAFKLTLIGNQETEFTSKSSEFLTQSGVTVHIPQLFLEPEYNLILDSLRKKAPPDSIITDEMMTQDLMSEKVDFLNQETLSIEDAKITFSLEEENVDYSQDNFKVEFFEIIDENNKEQLIPFESPQQLIDLFNIKFDESVDDFNRLRKSRDKNFFM
jgi:hypothetical protein